MTFPASQFAYVRLIASAVLPDVLPVRVDSNGIQGPCAIRPGGRRYGGPWNTVVESLEMLRDALPLAAFGRSMSYLDIRFWLPSAFTSPRFIALESSCNLQRHRVTDLIECRFKRADHHRDSAGRGEDRVMQRQHEYIGIPDN